MTDQANNTNDTNSTSNGEIRENLREAGDALLAAGSALGAAFSKAVEGLPERFKNASDSARETLNNASTEGEVRTIAANFTNEAEKAFNQLREGDLKLTEDVKATLRSKMEDIRTTFNERMDKAETEGEEQDALRDLRERFDDLVARIQAQFSDSVEERDIIDGEIVDGEENRK